MRCVQAVWPTESVNHEVIAVTTSGDGVIWTGAADGSIAKWTVSEDGVTVVPELFLFGHKSPVKSLINCVEGSGKDVLVSVDSEGLFCSWDCLSGVCQATCSHPELAGAIGTIAHHLGGRHVCFALDHSQNGVEGESGSPRRLHALVALDGVSLDLLEVWHPDVSIDIFQGKDDGSGQHCCIPVLLDLVSFPEAKSSYRDVASMIGISSAGKVLYWQFSGEKPAASDIMSWLLPDPCEALPTPLGAVSISRNGKKILLVSQSGWCLLAANSTDETGICPSKFRKLTGGTNVGETQPENFGHLAGGFILEEDQNGAGKSENPLDKLVFWDWSGRGMETTVASDGSKKNGAETHMQIPKDSMGDGFFTFVRARKGGIVHGVWSACIESWASGEEKESVSTKFDAGVNAFRSDMHAPFSAIARNSLSAVWDPGEGNSDQGGGKQRSAQQVTCLAVVGGVEHVPYTLVQGFSNGEITFSSLAAYAIPVPLDTMRNGLKGQSKQGKRRVGHWGPVTCLVELLFDESLEPMSGDLTAVADEVASGNVGKGMLASGGADGSVRFWSLEGGEVGTQLFCVHPHTGNVERITTSPRGSVSPWCECVATFGNDGIASLVSMETRKVERIMSGHPFGSFERVQWDGRRGFMACYGLMIGRLPHLVIWDLYSNQRDRAFVGEVAERAFDQFCHRVEAVSGGAEGNLVTPFQEATTSRVVQVNQQEKLLRIVEGPKKDIAFIEIDLPGLLSSPDSSLSMSCSVSFGCVLSLLHAWGIQRDSDIQLGTMLHALALTEPTSGAENPPPPCAKDVAQGISLTQGVVESRHGAVTVQVPYHVDSVFSSDGKVAESGAAQREAVAGPLWRHCPDFVARELVCLVAVSKKLMHDGLNETVCSACSSLVKLYAIEFLQSAPQVSDPSLDVLVQLWEDSNPILKETARVLLASMTDPDQLMDMDDANGGRLLGSAEVKDVIELWAGVGSDYVPGTSPRHDAAILVAGALCCVHSRLISDERLVATAPLLGILATSPKSHSCATAAAMLADALMAMEGEKWRNAVGDTHNFMQRLFNSCDEIHVGELESNSDAPMQPVAAPPPNQKAPPNPKSAMRHAKSMADLKLNDSNRSPLEMSPSQENASDKPTTHHQRTKTPFEMLKASSSKISRRLSPSRRSHTFMSNSMAGETGHFVPPPLSSPFAAAGARTGERSETVRYKEALVSVLMAIASLDLRLFMHSLASRLSGQMEHLEPYCVVSAAGALARLLHQRDGPRKIVFHLPLLISVLMRTLDPAQHGMRRVAHQGVHALLSEFATVFGMIDSDRVNKMLAVGYAMAQQKRPGTNALPEAIAVYDLQTGLKKKSLSLGRVLQQTGGHLGGPGAQTDQSGALGIGVLSFRRDGDVLAAYCPGAGVLCVWDLRSSWQHRLIKGPSQLEPIKVIQIHQVVDPNTWLTSFGSELKISWQLANQVAVMQGDKQLASVELHLGG
ncbi:hypothetical protein BSKO_06977 [Bryopsis sp. KO-2023]|nr:hypothetical protein BSKO_06977 [Bryopsis sp. KO-2023]